MSLFQRLRRAPAAKTKGDWTCPICLCGTYSRVLVTQGIACKIVATDSVQCEGCKETFPLLHDKAA